MTEVHHFSARQGDQKVHLRLMEITDIHMNVLPYDYSADRQLEPFGLARTASLIAEARQEATNSLLFDNGDFLQGTPMGDYIAYERGLGYGEAHPLIAAMNRLGVDACNLGNHDFNFGLDFLDRVLEDADFPVISANIVRRLAAEPRHDQPFRPPFAVLDRTFTDSSGGTHQIRMAVIGVLPPQVIIWDRRHLQGQAEVRGIVDAARGWMPAMKDAGADVIIALAHTGIGEDCDCPEMENAAIPLAALDGIDALLLGHKHQVFPSPDFPQGPHVDPERGTVHGKPAVMAGFWGSHLGLIDLLLENVDGTWRVVDFEVSTRAVADDTNSRPVHAVADIAPEIRDSVIDHHVATLDFVHRPVGTSATPIQSYFAAIGAASSVELINRSQIWMARRLLAGSPYADLPLLSAASPFKAGGRAGPHFYTDIPAGNLSQRHVSDIYIYPNTLSVLRVRGAELQLWLERAAGMFNRIVPGSRDAVLVDPAFSIYNFDTLAGLSYMIDLSQSPRFNTEGGEIDPSARRVSGILYRGRPLDDEMDFAVVTSNYRAGGGGTFPGAHGDRLICESDALSRNALIGFIQEPGALDDLRPRNWSFRPMPETSVIFETGPGATRYESEIADLDAECLGLAPNGFLRYRLEL